MPQLRRSRKLLLVGQGFAEFRVEGLVDDCVVKATWDGRCLTLSESLYQRALLAVAVDEIFVETGLVAERSRSTLCGTPGDVILTLARSCDALHVVEYTRRCSDHR